VRNPVCFAKVEQTERVQRAKRAEDGSPRRKPGVEVEQEPSPQSGRKSSHTRPKAPSLMTSVAARLKPCPDTNFLSTRSVVPYGLQT
jgi:hypothetical protein